MEVFLTVSRGPDAASAETVYVTSDRDVIRAASREIARLTGLEIVADDAGPREFRPQLVREARIVLRDHGSTVEVAATNDPEIIERLAPQIKGATSRTVPISSTTTPEVVLFDANGKREAATTDPAVVIAVMGAVETPYRSGTWDQLAHDARRRQKALQDAAKAAAREEADAEAARTPTTVVASYTRNAPQELACTTHAPDVAEIIRIIERAPDAPRHLVPTVAVGRLGREAYPDVSVTVHGGGLSKPVLARARSLPTIATCLKELAIMTMQDGKRNSHCDDHAAHVEKAIEVREAWVAKHGPIEPPKPEPEPEPEPDPVWRVAFRRGADLANARAFLSCDDTKMVRNIADALEHVGEEPTEGPGLTTPKVVQTGPGPVFNFAQGGPGRESPYEVAKRQERREAHWRRKNRVQWQRHRAPAARAGDRVFLTIEHDGEPLFATEGAADIAKAVARADADDAADNRLLTDDSQTIQWRRVGEAGEQDA